MMKQIFGFLGLLFFGAYSVSAQSYVGYTVDNYSGIHGLLLNPASVVDSNFRIDINIFSVSAFAGSDYFGLDLNSAFDNIEGEGFSFDDEVKRFPKDDNQFFVNVDVLGPSFMFNLNSKSSLGFTSRVRAFMNLNNINGELYENLQDDFDATEDFDFEMQDFNGTVHSWAEIGLTYGRILMNRNSNFLKAGVSLKYLQGAGATFINAPSVNGTYDAQAELLSSTGSLNYGESNDFDSEDIEFSNLSSGFGADIGLVYEYRPNKGFEDEYEPVGHSDYKIKLGVSITDIGSIKYDESTVTSYNLNNTVSKSRFEEEDWETILDEDYEGTETLTESKIGLPTAVNILADYKFKKRFYLALQGSLSLVGKNEDQTNRILNYVTAVPRYESKWFSFYLPVGIRQYDGFTMGTGLRLGPLSLGSGSVISNYLSDAAGTTDFYVGLKIPVYR